jgi:hypothetical protein
VIYKLLKKKKKKKKTVSLLTQGEFTILKYGFWRKLWVIQIVKMKDSLGIESLNSIFFVCVCVIFNLVNPRLHTYRVFLCEDYPSVSRYSVNYTECFFDTKCHLGLIERTVSISACSYKFNILPFRPSTKVRTKSCNH